MRRHLLKILIAGTALSLTAIGCGSDSDSVSNGSSAAAAVGPTKAEFIKSADAICVKTDREQEKAQIAFQKKYPQADSSKVWEEKVVVVAGLPPVQVEAEELGDLPAPTGDDAKVQEIVQGLEDAVEKGKAEPSLLLKKNSAGPFTQVVKLAREYGFKACVNPL